MTDVDLGARLAQLARDHGADEAVTFVDGPSWTWRELQAAVQGHAAGLQSLGVKQGEFVVSWLPNGPLAVLNLLALAQLGAIYVPINTGYRGGVLAHVLENSGARLMIAHGSLVSRLEGLPLANLREIVVIGEERPALAGIDWHDASRLRGDGAVLRAPERAVAPWDTLMVIYTSGTTGPSKGVLSSHRHACCAALGFRNVGPGDRNLTSLPMFHVGGVLGVLWALLHRGTVVIAESFSTSRFWEIVARHRITTTGLLGSMVDFLNAQPVRVDEQRHTLRNLLVAPYGPPAIEFARRFAVGVYTEFNMSELSVPLFVGPDPGIVGTCGLPAPGVTLRIVDANDEPVADGTVGELVLRMDRPWTISHGYLNDPVATARAWRNGWFHTGDLFRRDDVGHYHFVDRVADAIRRRGENISAFEVENGLREDARIADVAVVAVPAPGGSEQEVLAVVTMREGHAFEPASLLETLRPRLAPFMLPRYFRSMTELPRTPTQKVEKHRLRAEGITADTWDRESAGVRVGRDRLEQRG
ncbi:MAG: AMP-binding protein [Steroidobacteraceae bacterium]